jgi:hypothetical protein
MVTWPRLEGAWRDLRSDDAGREHARQLANELRAEIAPGHKIFGVGFEVIGEFRPRDDILIQLEDGRWAIAHVTWKHQDRPPWPGVRLVDAGRLQAEIDESGADYD